MSYLYAVPRKQEKIYLGFMSTTLSSPHSHNKGEFYVDWDWKNLTLIRTFKNFRSSLENEIGEQE